jgi:hypothetical protein
MISHDSLTTYIAMQDSLLSTFRPYNEASGADFNALPSCSDVVMGNTDEAAAADPNRCMIIRKHDCYAANFTAELGTRIVLWAHLEWQDTLVRQDMLRVRLLQEVKAKSPRRHGPWFVASAKASRVQVPHGE